MKKLLIIEKGSAPSRGLIAVAGAFWALQILACNLVSSAMLSSLAHVPGVLALGALTLGAFTVLFFLRLKYPAGRLPTILGGGSLAALIAFLWLAMHSHFPYEQIFSLLALSIIFAFAGIVLDMKRHWRRAVEMAAHRFNLPVAISSVGGTKHP